MTTTTGWKILTHDWRSPLQGGPPLVSGALPVLLPVVQFVRRMGWQGGDPDQWTVGLRDAYAAGLALAIPTGPEKLGWAMVP